MSNNPLKKMIHYALPAIIVIAALAIAVYFVKTKPRPKQKPPEEHAALVRVMELATTSTQLIIEASGSVIPSREIVLQARVSGEVREVAPDFQPGGHFSTGESILQIDPSDYEVLLAAAESQAALQELNYRNELGMQDIAKHEWTLLDSQETATELEQELVLRQPHLVKAETALNAATESVRKAQLDLQRCQITSPFNAMVLTRNVDLGAQVSAQSPLATLIGTDEYWVNITLPVNDLQWLFLPDADGKNGSHARISPAAGIRSNQEWNGRVIRLKPSLENQGRLAELLVAIPEPEKQTTGPFPLLLNSYVRVKLTGRKLNDIFIIPRDQIHDNQTVWLINSENRLHIQPVNVLWSDRTISIVGSGLTAGQHIVTSDIPAPVEDMLLISEDTARTAQGE